MNTLLYDRIRNSLTGLEFSWDEKKMMGGITFLIDQKMCFGTFQGGLLCRIDPAEKDNLLRQAHTQTVFQGGREMKGYVLVHPEGFETDAQLLFWIKKCLAYNPKAKSSKKK